MNIDRHNYEEYFILYMDNELGQDERREVEDFVQKHPDLKEELELLLQYKMVPDASIVFAEKEELMMPFITPAISLDNYEEWLVLYMDNELTTKQKITVEQFISTHPSVKKELTLLQQTQLQPEEIIFSNKEILYRRTEKRPVLFMMRRWAVAAALLIFALGIAMVVMFNKKSLPNKDIATAPAIEQKENPVVIKNNDGQKNKQPAIADAVQPIIESPKQANNNLAVKHNSPVTKKSPVTPVIQKEDNIIAKQQPDNNLPKPINNPNVNNTQDNVIANANTPNETIKPYQEKIIPVTTTTLQPSQVGYRPTDKDAELTQSGGKKGKLRGFLRKVTRTFEKTTNIDPADDENRVLIGGLAFKVN
ncbi:MAG: hypothetical protein ABUT20_15590 [Bacteroidota bacterium]